MMSIGYPCEEDLWVRVSQMVEAAGAKALG